jgi:class 3 adenylate cyclase
MIPATRAMDETASMQRRLAAILAADIAGYSRLMSEDEAATVRDLKGHQAVIHPLIGRYGGRIIDTAGDGILAEFPSVIGATECAIEIQTVMTTRNTEVPQHRRMLFRIGINLGDVIHDETRIYGDGINVAARLEGIAEPGGICVSRPVFEQVNRAVEAEFRALGPRRLKNIAQAVDRSAAEKDENAAMLTLMRMGWGKGTQPSASCSPPSSSPAGPRNRRTGSTSCNGSRSRRKVAVRIVQATGETDVTALLSAAPEPGLHRVAPPLRGRRRSGATGSRPHVIGPIFRHGGRGVKRGSRRWTPAEFRQIIRLVRGVGSVRRGRRAPGRCSASQSTTAALGDGHGYERMRSQRARHSGGSASSPCSTSATTASRSPASRS